jgi:hypothetical protein
MKIRLLILPILLLCAAAVSAQEIRLNGYASYVFDDRVNSYYDYDDYYDGTVEGGLMWGAGLEVIPTPYTGIEIMYLRMDTEAPMEYYSNGYRETNFDMAINYIMLNGNRYFPTGSDVVEPYLGGGLGAAIINVENPDNGYSDGRGFFAWGIKGGLNLNFAETVGLKMGAQLMSAVQSVGGGFYFGTGGAGAGVTTYSTFFQFGFTGGLVFKFNKGY